MIIEGPNNTGKTTILQALCLWNLGIKRWKLHRNKQSGAALCRQDLFCAPVPSAKELWHNQQTHHTRIEILVEGVTEDKKWECGMEFSYANEEVFYGRPLRLSNEKPLQRMKIPLEALEVNPIYLPPITGLASSEPFLQPGAIAVRIGEGRTAEVLRNICYALFLHDSLLWEEVAEHIFTLFNIRLDAPSYSSAHVGIELKYTENGTSFNILSMGSGVRQALFLLVSMHTNKDSVLLIEGLDTSLSEPYLNQVHGRLMAIAHKNNNQLIISASPKTVLNLIDFSSMEKVSKKPPN